MSFGIIASSATVSLPPNFQGFVSTNNSTSTPLNNGQTFTGVGEVVSEKASVTIAVLTDVSCDLFIQFSTDNINWDSNIPFKILANTNEVHRLTVTRQYFRIVIVNNSGVNQTFLRAQVLVGSQTQISSPLNSIIQPDSDTLVVRPLDIQFECIRRIVSESKCNN